VAAEFAKTSITATVSPPAGPIVGSVDEDGIHAFLGIHYAEPPTEERRFARPVACVPWTAPLDATSYGPTAPQRQSEGPLAGVLPNVVIPGDDYLNLNIWTPDPTASLPVMVFIHGGSWTSGSGAVDGYNGKSFARDGIVLVTINYRLGVDAFLWFGDGPANLGLLDQIAALAWVRDNIEAFGGDPTMVTVFGESAGAMSIGALLAMPAAAGLFKRAILQSGAAHHAIDAASAKLVATRLAVILGVAPTREAIAAVPRERILDAQAQLASETSRKPRKKLWGDVAANGMPFEPVIDGDTLPVLPITAIQHGASAAVEMIVGTNTEEALLVLAPAGVDKIRSWYLPLAAIRVGLPPFKAARLFRRAGPDTRPSDHLSDMLTDWVYRIPAIRLAEAHARTHVYEFAWRSPAFDGELGASHGVDLPFVFDTLHSGDWEKLTGSHAPQHLADKVHRAWVQFATHGDPGWPAYERPSRQVMHFDTESKVVRDPSAKTRRLWHGKR
jgi:para-nitrobenzyl esterase